MTLLNSIHRTLATASRTAAAAAGLLLAGTAHAQHDGDVGLALDARGRIVTELHTDTAVELARVFSSSFGDSGVPFFTQNPGFDAESGTFPAAARIGFSFRTELRRWTGDGFAPTNAADPLLGERVRASFSTLSATTGAGPVEGFSLAVQADGGWHRHISWTLQPAAGAAAPASGVYLLELSMWCTDPSVLESRPFWIVMSAGAPAADVEAAIHWVLDSVPNECASDIDASGAVDGLDLAALLANWGGSGEGDTNGDGTVDGVDLAEVLAGWGECP